jgi:hypothetical protein
MKKLLTISLLFATQNLLSMEQIHKKQKPNRPAIFIPIDGRRIPLNVVRCDADGNHPLPIDTSEVMQLLENKKALLALLEMYGTDQYPLDNLSRTIALLFARGEGGYRTIEKGTVAGIARQGFFVLNDTTMTQKEFVALKAKCSKLALFGMVEMDNTTLKEAQHTYFSLFPQKNTLKVDGPFDEITDILIARLTQHKIPSEDRADGSKKFFLNKK